MMRLVQLQHRSQGRRVARVEEPNLRLLSDFDSVWTLAERAIEKGGAIEPLVLSNLSDTEINYDRVYQGLSDWQLLPSYDHPQDPCKLMLSGTGLTHKASAENRQKMHEAAQEVLLTDSMKIYLWGVEGGHPKKGSIGIQPEWFYKGNGSVLRAHGDDLEIPPYGNDGGEEPELAGVYLNDRDGKPWRIGFTTANEFSDHIMERKNYLYLAPSKIRNCAIGPELVVTSKFEDIHGEVSIVRKNATLWRKAIHTGERNMAHSLANLEYHHFKYANHRLPGQGHVHFFGADAFSFGAGIELQENDVMQIDWQGMGRPLRNVLVKSKKHEKPIGIGIMV
jgi:hypothetical protein